MANYRKRVLQDVEAALEEEVQKNNIKEVAHVRISKLLVRAYNNSDVTKDMHVQEYLIEQMIDWPHTVEFVACNNRHLVFNPNFLTRLVIAKRVRKGDGTIDDRWWRDLMGGLLEKGVFDLGDEHCCARGDLLILAEFCNRCSVALEHLMSQLDRGAPSPKELFPLGPVGREDRSDGEEIVEHELPDVWDMLTRLPRFVEWLVMSNDGKSAHGYTEQEVARLRQFAFVQLTKDFDTDESAIQKCEDEGWQRALGLRGLFDVFACEKCIKAGMTFAEAHNYVKDKTPQEVSRVRQADLLEGRK